MSKDYFVYILATCFRGTLYIGVTSNLVERIFLHKQGIVDGFTKKYQIYRLVYFENVPCVTSAIQREKQLKKWNRQWKINLIEGINPEWNDLSENIF